MFWEPIIWNIFNVDFYFLEGQLNFFEIYCLVLNILLGQLLILIGLFGIIRRFFSLLLVLLSLELALLGINFMTVLIGLLINQPVCLILSLIFLVLAAVETSLGLSLVYLYHKAFLSTSLSFLTKIRY
jgi:NADH-quinone oxidoreductase subunit K